MWDAYINGFKAYLMLERSLSDNTTEAYVHDVTMLRDHMSSAERVVGVEDVKLSDLQDFLITINELELAASTQARILSGVKSFYRFLELEEVVKNNPTVLLEAPKIKRTLPHVLSVEDVDKLFSVIDHSTPDGMRNRAMLETMYSCGLRVSELTGMLISNLYLDLGFVKVLGKGDKERLVPIGGEAIKHILLYKEHIRVHMPVQHGKEDFLFLSKRGAPLSRIMVFYIIKENAAKAGLSADVHPHTLRHSFATHLVERGADLRAVQEMMGHKSITTTEIYTHLDKSFLRTTLEKYHPRYK